MQCYFGTDTSSTVDIYGLMEARGETRRLGGVSVYWSFYKPTINARDQARIRSSNLKFQ